MLSNPHSNLQERHRQHRRQISTPTALDAAKAPALPSPALRRYHAHRRGQSLDQRALHIQRPKPVQGEAPSINTNPGLYQNPQHVLREAQQQRLARTGHPAFQQPSSPPSFIADCQSFSQEDLQAITNLHGNENDPNLACMTANSAGFDDKTPRPQPLQLALDRIRQQQLRGGSLSYGNTFDRGAWEYYSQDNLASIPQQANHVPASLRRLSVQADISPRMQRPHTPTNQTHAYHLPITPATTPFRNSGEFTMHSKDTQPSPTKSHSLSVPHGTQSSYMQRARSLQGVAGTTFTQPKVEVPSPPNTASFNNDSLDVFDCQQESSFEDAKLVRQSQSQYIASSSASSSFYSSPELAEMPSPVESGEPAQKLPIHPATPRHLSPRKMSSATPNTSPAKPKLSPRVASIDNLNLDARVQASITETGITIDEIASYIHGPDPEDGKWVCLHPGCERRFGRKENIKSHVQTHLGDRQYKCDHCSKCFVRGHDLKRHAKIHTGDKPYECLCGNVFARHDALTRHRQRGMCIGGYKGIVRKTTKRGRPKKHRPELDERQNKAARTRQRVAEKSASTSISGSDFSRNSPAFDILENMSTRDSSPMENAPVFHTPNYSLPPEVLTFTPPASPGGSNGNRPSPRSYRSLTPNTEDELLPLPSSKRPLEQILSESGLPLIVTDVPQSSSNTLSSPHTAPTLADSCSGSDFDVFISPGASTGFAKHELGIQDPGMIDFSDYTNVPSLDGSMDLFPGKGFSTNETLSDEFFSFQFQVDEQPSDVLSRDFFLE